ncbi:MAG: hypothetical protein M3512_07730, partial [Bacteroidota bacterium]|nr:hypothetical protein [Bacteroidota bacterium]
CISPAKAWKEIDIKESITKYFFIICLIKYCMTQSTNILSQNNLPDIVSGFDFQVIFLVGRSLRNLSV